MSVQCHLPEARTQFFKRCVQLTRGRIILKWILRKYGGTAWTGFTGSGQEKLKTPSQTEMRLRVP